jgi:hypothetical protein
MMDVVTDVHARLPTEEIDMLRKQLLTHAPVPSAPRPGEKDIAVLATVLMTSEDPHHPVEHLFDHRRGPGGSRWIAARAGEQVLILAFDAPQTIRRILLEVEEPDVARTQELQVAVSHDGGRTYRELVRQEYNFSPPGTTFEREEWSVTADGVSHRRLAIRPDKGAKPCRATVTSLALE